MRFPTLATLALLASATQAAAQTNTPRDTVTLRQRAVADSNHPGAHYDLAMARWEGKDWNGAEASLRTAIKISPSYADAYLALSAIGNMRGEKYWKEFRKQKGDSAEAKVVAEERSFYRRAFLLNPLVSLKPLGKYEVAMSAYAAWAREMEKGVNELYQGRYADAFKRLDGIKRDGVKAMKDSDNEPIFPPDLLWHHALAAAHLDSFDIAAGDMIDLFSQVQMRAELNPGRVDPIVANDYRYFTATMLYLGGHSEEAIKAFQIALENDISLYVAHVQMARMYEEKGDQANALLERQRALDTNPEDPDLMVDLAAAFIKQAKHTDAIPILENAASLNPRDARIPYLRGAVAVRAGDAPNARKWLERFVAIAPSTFAAQVTSVRAQLDNLP